VGLWAGVDTKRKPFRENSETYEIKGCSCVDSGLDGLHHAPEYSEEPVVARYGNFSLSSN